MSAHFLINLPVIHHETGFLMSEKIYLLASISTFIIYIIAGYRKNIPLSRLLLAAATFFIFFALGSRLPGYSNGEWNQLPGHGQWPSSGNKTILGGLAGMLAGMWFLAAWSRNSHQVFDQVAIALPVGMSIQRINCLLSGCCAGTPTSLPWAVRYDQHADAWNSQLLTGRITATEPCSLPVHPTQIYDILAWVFILFITCQAVRFLHSPGNRLLFTLLLYGLFRFFLEFLRDPFYDVIQGSSGGIKNIQWIILSALPFLAFIIIIKEKRLSGVSHQDEPEEIIFWKHLILTMIVVALFLITYQALNLHEILAMTLLLATLFFMTVINIFRKTDIRSVIIE